MSVMPSVYRIQAFPAAFFVRGHCLSGFGFLGTGSYDDKTKRRCFGWVFQDHLPWQRYQERELSPKEVSLCNG